MKDFRSNVRRRALTLCGCMEGLKIELSGEEVEGLDIEIMNLAHRVMPNEDGKFHAFQLAYICTPSWQEIDRIYNKFFGESDEDFLETKTIKRYAGEGEKKILDKASEMNFEPQLPKAG